MSLSLNEDLLTSEIESWNGFEYALREENRLLFHQMLSKCKKNEYVDCVNSKGKNSSAEALFLLLVFEQQKMINELIHKLRKDV
jgi:hypothetical protein